MRDYLSLRVPSAVGAPWAFILIVSTRAIQPLSLHFLVQIYVLAQRYPPRPVEFPRPEKFRPDLPKVVSSTCHSGHGSIDACCSVCTGWLRTNCRNIIGSPRCLRIDMCIHETRPDALVPASLLQGQRIKHLVEHLALGYIGPAAVHEAA